MNRIQINGLVARAWRASRLFTSSLLVVCTSSAVLVGQTPQPEVPTPAPSVPQIPRTPEVERGRSLDRQPILQDRGIPNLPEDTPEVFDLGSGIGFASGPASALTTVGGYIDSAIISNRIRLRFDAAYNNPVPDRNQFFYPEDGSGGLGNETRIDYQEIATYIEWAPRERFSLFVEVPVRFLNPEVNPNEAGLADMNAGFKWALWQCPCDALTFQLRTYLGTGEARGKGLGVGFASIEPALLYHRKLSDRLSFEGELRGWIPTADNPVRSGPFLGEDFSGEMLRYGAGFGYDLFQSCDCRCQRSNACSCGAPACDSKLTSVVELVGWTVLDGFGTFTVGMTSEIRDVSGDTIFNLKIGGRYTRGCGTFFAGWGHVITSDQWYEDIVRIEYERRF
ncbi:MAG: hypothetical protein KDA42_10015 [Planctomycetales bacterium]|nr:hypothetical protein [Planctomycetales bacterium]